ncbi:MAG: phosphoadenosine phosphosulfate reductase [marine bacterium B5-7]|nr:MAG: phosphoadenosine phosphosulfate reductase [marine bacterium B5-7]
MSNPSATLVALQSGFNNQPGKTPAPRDILKAALEHFDAIALSFSGAEDIVLIDMATRIRPDIAVFTLDTGRLHAQTHEYMETVRNHYKLDLEVLFPDTGAVQSLVREQGLFDFRERGHKACCAVRKVAPLRGKLAQLDAWITGQRRDQSEGTRSQLDVVEIDSAFQGANGTLIKFNPLAHWSSKQVWNYIREHEVPFNPLHTAGFISIGCEPCTRPVHPGQHEREGRWWWEDAVAKECGLHADNLRKAG